MQNDQIGLTLGGIAKQMILLNLSHCITNEDEKAERQRFSTLFHSHLTANIFIHSHWTANISSVADNRQCLKRVNKSKELPLMEDLETYAEYLKQKCLQND